MGWETTPLFPMEIEEIIKEVEREDKRKEELREMFYGKEDIERF